MKKNKIWFFFVEKFWSGNFFIWGFPGLNSRDWNPFGQNHWFLVHRIFENVTICVFFSPSSENHWKRYLRLCMFYTSLIAKKNLFSWFSFFLFEICILLSWKSWKSLPDRASQSLVQRFLGFIQCIWTQQFSKMDFDIKKWVSWKKNFFGYQASIEHT